MTRRDFLKTTGAGAFAVAATKTSLFAAQEEPPLRVALIGCGWYGKTDLFHLIQVAPVEVVGLCDVDRQMVEAAADMVELEVKDAVTAETVGFLGSPSIRIDGEDVEHTARTAGGFGLMCRTYIDGDRRVGVPPWELIRAAVRKARIA